MGTITITGQYLRNFVFFMPENASFQGCFTEVSFATSEGNQLSYFQNGYLKKIFDDLVSHIIREYAGKKRKWFLNVSPVTIMNILLWPFMLLSLYKFLGQITQSAIFQFPLRQPKVAILKWPIPLADFRIQLPIPLILCTKEWPIPLKKMAGSCKKSPIPDELATSKSPLLAI